MKEYQDNEILQVASLLSNVFIDFVLFLRNREFMTTMSSLPDKELSDLLDFSAVSLCWHFMKLFSPGNFTDADRFF